MKNKFIQSAKLNDQPFNRTWIDHSEIANGGVLEFEMGPEPNKKWGTENESCRFQCTGGNLINRAKQINNY